MKVKKDNLKERIIERINSMSRDKLENIDEFIESIWNDKHSKDKILSFSGKWKDMDNEIFQNLTEDLQKKRMEGRSRIL